MISRFFALVSVLALSSCILMQHGSPRQQALERWARGSLNDLVTQNPGAAAVNRQAVAVLVFPNVVKAGFIYGGQTGNGVLFRNGVASGIYNTSAVSYGLQAGVQDYGYALFFMNENALSYLNKSGGLELGVGPSVVVADKGFAKSYTTTTLTQDVYAFAFDQKGVMAGLGITGSKITKIAQ